MADEPAVSPGQTPPAQPGQSTSTSPAPAAVTPPAGTPPAGAPPPAKTGFDAFPDAAKDVIRRNAEGKRQAEARATAAESELAKIKLASAPKPTDNLDPETKEQVELLRKLGPIAGFKTDSEVKQMMNEYQAQEEARRVQEADVANQEAVIAKFDGTNMPKVTKEELDTYYGAISADPNLQYLKGAPWEEIAKKMKETEIRQMEVDRILQKGGQLPPKIEKGAGSGQAPINQVKKYDSPADMQKGLLSDLRTSLKR